MPECKDFLPVIRQGSGRPPEVFAFGFRDVDAFALPLMNSQALLLGDRAEDFNQNVVVALAQGNFDLDKAKDALWGLSVDGLAFFKGFPLKNYSNIVNGIFSNLSDTISGHSTYFGSSGGRKGSEYANSYDVLIDNNPEKAKQQLETFYNEKYEEQIAKGETTTKAKKKAQTSVRTALTTQYKKEYQKAFLNNDRDKMQKISKKLQKSGYMKWDGKSLSTVLGEWTKSAQEDSNK